MSWRPYIPFFTQLNALRYKKGKPSQSNSSQGVEPQYIYCKVGRVARSKSGFTCFTTVDDAVNESGDSQFFETLPAGAVVVPSRRRGK